MFVLGRFSFTLYHFPQHYKCGETLWQKLIGYGDHFEWWRWRRELSWQCCRWSLVTVWSLNPHHSQLLPDLHLRVYAGNSGRHYEPLLNYCVMSVTKAHPTETNRRPGQRSSSLHHALGRVKQQRRQAWPKRQPRTRCEQEFCFFKSWPKVKKNPRRLRLDNSNKAQPVFMSTQNLNHLHACKFLHTSQQWIGDQGRDQRSSSLSHALGWVKQQRRQAPTQNATTHTSWTPNRQAVFFYEKEIKKTGQLKRYKASFYHRTKSQMLPCMWIFRNALQRIGD